MRALLPYFGFWALSYAAPRRLELGHALALGPAALGLRAGGDMESGAASGALGWQQAWEPAWARGGILAGAWAEGPGASSGAEAGLAWRSCASAKGWVSAQLGGGQGGAWSARLGAQAPLPFGILLRSGLSGGSAALAAHGGLGWIYGPLELAWAFSAPAGGWEGGAELQSLALHLDWGAARPSAPKPELLRLTRSVLSGELLSARVELRGLGSHHSGAWTLALFSESGTLEASFQGEGAPPAPLVWNGQDPQGRPSSSRRWRYESRLKGPDGRTLLRKGWLEPPRPLPGEAQARALAEEEDGYGWTRHPSAALLGERAGAQLQLGGGLENVEGLEGDAPESWQLAIVSAEGEERRSFQGKGPLPSSLAWDGMEIEEGLRYTLKVSTRSGRRLERRSVLARGTGPEEPDAVQARGLQRRDTQRALEGRLSTQSACSAAEEPGSLRCILHFPFGDSVLDEAGLKEMQDLRRLVSGARLAELRVEGHADSVGEGMAKARLSQARADWIMAALLGDYGLRPNLALSLGLGDAKPVDQGVNEAARARNRRVEVLLKF